MGKIDTDMRLFDMEKHWEIIEKNPHLVRDFKAGFKLV